MQLDTDKARLAGRDVLTAADELLAVHVPDALRSAAARLRGLGIGEALSESADGYADYVKRFGNELQWLGHAVVSAADIVDETDEAAKASIEQTGTAL